MGPGLFAQRALLAAWGGGLMSDLFVTLTLVSYRRPGPVLCESAKTVLSEILKQVCVKTESDI